jgi:hypothetical protein
VRTPVHILVGYRVSSGFDSASDPIDVQPRIGCANEDQAYVVAQLARTPYQLERLPTGESGFDCEIAPVSKSRGDALQCDTARGESAHPGCVALTRQGNLVRINSIADDNRRHQLD